MPVELHYLPGHYQGVDRTAAGLAQRPQVIVLSIEPKLARAWERPAAD